MGDKMLVERPLIVVLPGRAFPDFLMQRAILRLARELRRCLPTYRPPDEHAMPGRYEGERRSLFRRLGVDDGRAQFGHDCFKLS
jgi:hypothetical protein